MIPVNNNNTGHTKKITELYAFVHTNRIGGEGIISFSPDNGKSNLPMIGADINRVDTLREIADHSGVSYRILHFKLTGEIEKII